ncbi:MAG: FkbM family methyltransferase [Herpetosiphonaceae bacterium]|nr:FkbM family methyltransferase [Herpetosiphonaceae bacterium]
MLMTPVIKEPLRHIRKLITEPGYRRFRWLLSKYSRAERFTEHVIQVNGWHLRVPDLHSFLYTYKSIFVDEIYAFNAPSEAPYIIDCGANIGLSVLYFKRRFPQATILAFEPDPLLAAVLEANLQANGVRDVTVVQKALWSSETVVRFRADGADGGRIDLGQEPNLLAVPTVRLSSYLNNQPVDCLKIDIEGAEGEVLHECAAGLAHVRYVFVEFHSFAGRPQELGSLIKLFETRGFRSHIHPHFSSPTPFLYIAQNDYAMDMQLNLFFIRDNQPKE